MLDWTIRSVRRRQAKPAPAPHLADSPGDSPGGLVAGTLVATSNGWMPVGQIAVGDAVMTFDDGVQQVIGITRRLHPTSEAGLRPLVSVRAGLIGNRRPMLLPEGQAMLVESDFAEVHLGDPFVTMQVSDLLGLSGARRVLTGDRVALVTVAFADDQMIFVEGQALAYCPAPAFGAAEAARPPRYPLLSRSDAELVVAGMAGAEDGPVGPAAEPSDAVPAQELFRASEVSRS